MGNLLTSRIALALVFAFAILASAFVLKGNLASETVQFGILGVGLVFVVLRPNTRSTSY